MTTRLIAMPASVARPRHRPRSTTAYRKQQRQDEQRRSALTISELVPEAGLGIREIAQDDTIARGQIR